MKQGMWFALVLLVSATPGLGQWRNSISTDEMTGHQSAYAMSPRTSATEAMDFPYTDTVAWLGFGCDADGEWAYVGFSEGPNLTNTETRDGYNSLRTRVKWDDAIVSMNFTQAWGESFLHFSDDARAIANMSSAKTCLLELRWYGEGPTYFRFSLDGSSEAISEARRMCQR